VNPDVLKWTVKASRPMSWGLQKETTHSSEMNDKAFGLDLNVRDIARNVMEPISFDIFHG
jgi:hypothetical protein